MGKDREGTFHPPAGKPSGEGRQTETTVNEETLHKQIELEEKYGIDPDTREVSGVRMAHPNRNVGKDEDRKRSESAKRPSDKATTSAMSADMTSVEPQEIQLSREAITELFHHRDQWCISLFAPTHRTGVEVNEEVDTILFKNLLQQAASELTSRGYPSIEGLLEPGYRLLRNQDFWRANKAAGLAVFIGNDLCRYVRLPLAPEERLQVNHSFLVSPLVTYVMVQDYFFLLVVSKKQSKLFRVNRFGIQYLPLSEMPNGIEDVVHLEEKDDQGVFRTGSSGPGGGANYHGIGSGVDEKENIAMYLAEVDSTIRKEVLRDEHVPLLVAGVDYLVPIFRKVSHYNHIWSDALTGSHEHDSEQQLFNASLPLMQPYFEERKAKALAAYGNQSATERTSSITEDVVRAAYYSRIAALFIEKDLVVWGTFDEQNDRIELHEREQPGDENLADKAVWKTILNGGVVYTVERNEVPQGGQMAAVMRY